MRKLRVAFVMGGGVSLGTFSGGALGEVVRILSRWQEAPGKSVEIDVCAGASAGALSLGLMLRTLSHPGAARATLGSPAPPLERLVKEVQRHAWVEEVSLRKLAGAPPAGGAWKSLLDRSPLERVSRRLLEWPEGQAHDRRLLAPRVLFHNTLSNLNGVPFDARPGWDTQIVSDTAHALADALWTGAFKDRRVFDLRFPDVGSGPPRIAHVYPGEIEDAALWEEIAGTAIACSAFPMAFEPVVLRRFRFEYAPRRRQIFGDDDEKLFTYSDGGVFDNDPMGDALALCRKLDAARPFGPGEARLIVYIDPNVGSSKTDLSLALHQDIVLKDDRAKKAGYLDRALGQGGRLAAAVLGEVRHKDEASIAFDPESDGRYSILGVGTLDPDAPPLPEEAAPEPERLWGAAGANFAGFLDRQYREHDFAIGELHAFRGMKRFFGELIGETIPVRSPPGPPPGKRPEKPEDAKVLRGRIKRALDDAIPIPTAILSVVVPLLTPVYRTLVTNAAAAAVIEQDPDNLPSLLVPLRLEVTGLPRRATYYHHFDGDTRNPLKVRRGTNSTVFDTVLRIRQRPGARYEWGGPGMVREGGQPFIKILFRRKKQGSRPLGRVKEWCGLRLTGLDWALAKELDGMGKGLLVGRAAWKSKKKVRVAFEPPRDELEAWHFPVD